MGDANKRPIRGQLFSRAGQYSLSLQALYDAGIPIR